MQGHHLQSDCLAKQQLPLLPFGVPAGKQQLRINSSSLPAVRSPTSSPVKPNVYGFTQRSFVSIPGMLFEQIMQVGCCTRARPRDVNALGRDGDAD
jgi:hypothetical protein